MSEEEFDKAIQVGVDLVDDCVAEGCRVLSIGEMGIANTSPSSIWMHLFGNIPLDECIGAGAGLNNDGIRHKYEILSQSSCPLISLMGSKGCPLNPIHP